MPAQEKKEKKVLLPTGVSKSTAHTVNMSMEKLLGSSALV
jgi:hypothetical protein